MLIGKAAAEFLENPANPLHIDFVGDLDQIVAEFAPATRMVWSGGMPLGLFRGERTFTLSPQPEGWVRFVMREEYTGLLAGLIGRSIPDLQPAFDEFAADLKKAAEKGSN